MRERLQQVKKALLRRAQVTLADIIAKEEELAQRDPQPAPVGSANHARGAMTFVSYLFIYGMIRPSSSSSSESSSSTSVQT
jgi:hypothetical protein